MFRLSKIRFGSMDSWAGSRGRNPTVRLRHLGSIGRQTLLSSASSLGLNSFLNRHLIPSLPTCVHQYYT
jgi:hypothetical protein